MDRYIKHNMISLCHAHWQHAFFFLDCVCTLSRFSCECWTYFYRQKVLACLKSDEHTHIRCGSVCVCVCIYVCMSVCYVCVCVCILLNQFVLCAWRDLQFPSELLPHSPTDLIVRVEAEGVREGENRGKRTNCSGKCERAGSACKSIEHLQLPLHTARWWIHRK